jgi:hypothetical protein
MERKVVSSKAVSLPLPSGSDNTLRAIELLIAKDGVFRTNEKWVYSALRQLVAEGYVTLDDNVISIGNNFESLLLNLAARDSRYAPVVGKYRIMVRDAVAKYDVQDFEVMESVHGIKNTEEKIIYLTSVLSETFGKLGVALENISRLEALIKEMDVSLSVMESMTFDEDSDG